MRATVLAAATVGLLLTACTGGASQPSANTGTASDGGGKTVKYLIEEQEDAEAFKALETHIGDFEKESGIDVTVSTLPLDTMRTVLQTQLRSGEGPDVFNWGSGPGFGGALAKAGLLMDLTDQYTANKWQVYDFAKERVTFDGKTYGVPGEMETIGIFYNKDLFSKLGITEPKTMADLEAAAKKIKADGNGVVPMAVSDKEGWQGGHLLSMALSSDIGSEGLNSLLNGSKSWNSPEVVSALKVWQDFNKAGYLPKSPTSVDYDTSTASFYSGEAAMIPTGSWLVAEIDNNAKFEAGYIPFPSPDGPGIFTGGLGSGPFVSAGTKNRDAALKFVNFLASPEHGRWTVENLATIPPQPVDTKGLKVSPLFAKVLKDTETLSTSSDFGVNIDVLTTDKFNETMYDGVQAVLTGQQTPEEVAAELQQAAEKK
jgi:raffinose/stachyose/melibiose transport system substrate-binding protein